MLNLQSKTSYYQFDDAGMLVVPTDESWGKRSWWKKLWDKILKREWTPTWSNKSWRDSIGRTVLAWIAYEKPDELAYKLEFCYNSNSSELYRHPAFNELASRDHWSYFIIYRKLLHNGVWFKNFIKNVPRMRGINLWMKSLTGNRTSEFLYYLVHIPGARLGNMWLKVLRRLGNISDEWDNQEWINWQPFIFVNSPWQKLFSWIIFKTIPAYSLHVKAWQLYIFPESDKKQYLQKILLKRVGKSNILLRLLLGDTNVTKQEVYEYPHMTGYRPGVYLDESCRRDIREMTAEEAEFNTYEKELIKWLYGKYLLNENGGKLLKEDKGRIEL